MQASQPFRVQLATTPDRLAVLLPERTLDALAANVATSSAFLHACIEHVQAVAPAADQPGLSAILDHLVALGWTCYRCRPMGDVLSELAGMPEVPARLWAAA